MIDPHFAYAAVVYDGCNITSSKQLQVHQNNALRAVLNVDSRYSTEALHTKTGIKWPDTSRKERCIETYKTLHGLNPPGIEKLFPPITHTRALRSLSAPNTAPRLNRTKWADNNLPNRCFKYWQSLPNDVKNISTLSALKSVMSTGNYFQHVT